MLRLAEQVTRVASALRRATGVVAADGRARAREVTSW
jgi:hypothetical protein